MLILLPPSEGKTPPATGQPLQLESLALPGLNPTRERLLRTLMTVCQGNRTRAMKRLGLGPTQADAVERNARLLDEPTSRADEVYTGVLYAAWDPPALSDLARKRADEQVAIVSALFGLVRPGDRIPAYRLSGTVSLPRLGTVAGVWRARLGPALDELVDDGLLVDLRSGTYVNLHKPTGDLAARTATIRVLHEHGGTRKVVSHFNKATKGRIVRALLEAEAVPDTPAALTESLRGMGYLVVEEGDEAAAAKPGKPRALDVVVTEL